MKMKFMPLLLLLPVLMLVLAGCSGGISESDIEATVEARVELAKASLVAPTAVPLPTYTPLPTLTPQVIINEVVVTATPTATSIPTATPIPTPTPTPKPYTEVGGLLRSDTTWGLADSPYLVTASVQIPEGITLTIEAGVEVQVNEAAEIPFNVQGILRVHGSQMSPVYLRGEQGLFPGQGANLGSLIDIRFAILEGFSFFFSEHGDQTTVKVRDSVFRDIEDSSRFGDSQFTIRVERSRFENAAGFRFSGDNNTLLFQNNCFVSKKHPSRLSSSSWFAFSKPPNAELTVIQDNAFLDSGTLAFRAGAVASSVPVFIGPNYYGTTDATIIDQMVYDSSDDLNLNFRIIVAPILETSPIEGCP